MENKKEYWEQSLKYWKGVFKKIAKEAITDLIRFVAKARLMKFLEHWLIYKPMKAIMKLEKEAEWLRKEQKRRQVEYTF